MNAELSHLMDKFVLTEYGSTVKTDCVYEVLVHDVKNKPNFEAMAIFHKYPNYTDMMTLFNAHGIKVTDFADHNSCMKDRLVFGEAYGVARNNKRAVALFTIERIKGKQTKFEELLR